MTVVVEDVQANAGADLCLDTVILSDPTATAIEPVSYPVCVASPSPPPPPPLSLVITLSGLVSNTFTVSYDTTIPFAGYQFTVAETDGTPVPFNTDGGVSAFPELSVSVGATGTVVGFSLTAATIPIGSGVLVTLTVPTDYNPASNTAFCLKDIIFSSPSAEAIPVTYECEGGFAPPAPPAPSGVIVVTVTSIAANGQFVMSYSSDVLIAGYQMDVYENIGQQPLILESAVSAFNFITASAGPSNVMIGFSLSATPIPSGSGELATVQIADQS